MFSALRVLPGWVCSLLCLARMTSPGVEAATFEVPGFEKELARLEDLYRRHRVIGPDTTLWDAWLPMSVLWLDTTNPPALDTLRATYRERLLQRRIDAEGYVSTQQHEGLAHSEGWPFPLHTQAGGVGWLFTLQGVPYGAGFGIRPTTTVTNWVLSGATTVRLDPDAGWTVKIEETSATLVSPPFAVDSLVAPFLRLKWSVRGAGPEAAGSVDWQADPASGWDGSRRLYFGLPRAEGVVEDVNLPMYRHPEWKGRAVRFRFELAGMRPGAEVTIQRLFTAIDSRHNANNALYLQACDDYLRWTGDVGFLRRNLQRMRLALAWALREFRIAETRVVTTAWVGHEGRSGHAVDAQGKRTLRPGVGVGNNYWDLLPFGGEDALATVYYFDAIRRMAALERQVVKHPEWNLPGGPLQFDPAELVDLSRDLQAAGHERFWNPATERFVGWRDPEGIVYDYGFTFVNNEAISYGFAGQREGRAIRDWIDGRRVVAGDTSTGADIYHWRFGPRATTRRNLEAYFWGWSDPGSIPWGGQVQDGGAVLGFSFHDLMARLEVDGPDRAWERLREVLAWYGEVQDAGGYRPYYADPARGATLQGGGTAGGLGLDHEFFESVLVPQVMLYGFLGFHPRLDGCLVAPRLPAEWPSLTVRGIRLHDVSLDVTATRDRVRVTVRGEGRRPLHLVTPGDENSRIDLRPGTVEVTRGVSAPKPAAPH